MADKPISMNNTSNQPVHPDYGIDFPKELRRNGLYGLGGIVMGLCLELLASGGSLGVLLGTISLISGIVLVITVSLSYLASKKGKLGMRDQILAQVPWRGNEQVLDIGCGRGLMLIGAAKHLKTGMAFGVDIWLADSQWHNAIEATLSNATLEGVSDRVKVRQADARDLPFDNNTFDVVLSSWAIHTLIDPEERTQALKEIARVLKPGGRVILVDFDFVKEYVRFFEEKNWTGVKQSGANRMFVTPTYTLSAMKNENG